MVKVVILLAVLAVITVASHVHTSEERDYRRLAKEAIRAPELINYYRLQGDKSVICKDCHVVFKFVKKVVGKGGDITRDKLEKVLNAVCEFLPKTAPYVQDICDKLGPDAINKLYEAIVNVDKAICPKRICGFLKLCPVNEETLSNNFLNGCE